MIDEAKHLDGCRFIETTLGVVSNALLYLLLLTMDCRGRVIDEADNTYTVVGSSKPQLSIFRNALLLCF